MPVRAVVAVGALLMSSSLCAAEMAVVRMDRGSDGDFVMAVDLSARKVAWEAKPCQDPNFVKVTSSGVLVGCEQSIVLMLNPQTGKELWRRNLSVDQPEAVSGKRPVRKYDINRFHVEKPEGFVLSSDAEDYFLVGKDGRYLTRCDRACGETLERDTDAALVTAVDSSARDVVGEAKPCQDPNFFKKTSVGVLVGCEQSVVLMLDPQTGKELWRRNLTTDQPTAVSGKRSVRKYDINHFHVEKPEGFVLSSDADDYFLIGRDGRYLIRCDLACGNILKTAPLHAGKLIMRWHNAGASRSIAAFDVAAGKMAWEMSACRTANFAAVTSIGIVVGCDDANLFLLDSATGKEMWRRDLAAAEDDETLRTKLRINRFHGESPEGFFVSSADVVYILVDKKGDYIMRCDQAGCRRPEKVKPQ